MLAFFFGFTLDTARIVAVPFFSPFRSPFFETDTTFLFEVVYVTVRYFFLFGVTATTGFNWYFFPFWSFHRFPVPLNFTVRTFADDFFAVIVVLFPCAEMLSTNDAINVSTAAFFNFFIDIPP